MWQPIPSWYELTEIKRKLSLSYSYYFILVPEITTSSNIIPPSTTTGFPLLTPSHPMAYVGITFFKGLACYLMDYLAAHYADTLKGSPGDKGVDLGCV